VSFTVGALDSGEVAHRLDREYAIASRGGLHCAPWAHKTIGTLATGTVRFSPGCFTTEADIAAALEAVARIAGEKISIK
jgi:selenocysteine lyase/cysteine desulfurase